MYWTGVQQIAKVHLAKLVYAIDSKSIAERRRGSSPLVDTTIGIVMQVVKIYSSFTKKKSSNSKKLAAARTEHENWLKKNGVHPEQIKHAKKQSIGLPTYSVDKGIKTSDTIVDGGRAKGIMINLNSEPEHVRREIKEKASRCVPLYNKGGYMLASKNEDMTKIGSLSRRN